jgi:hypothetical protein
MRKVLLLSAVALLALGCATASSIQGSAVARDGGTIAIARPVAAPVQQAAAREPTAAPSRVAAAGGVPMTAAMATDQYRGPGAGTKALGHAPSNGYGNTRMNPAASAFGGVDNNPVEGPGLDISEVKDHGGARARKDTSGRVLNIDRRARDKMTRSSWIEGSNPAEDGNITSRNEVTPDAAVAKAAKSGRPNGKLNEKLSPLAKIADNNPVDESSDALEVPRQREASSTADRYRHNQGMAPTVQNPRVTLPERAPREIARPNSADRVLWRRSAVSDNNPFDN